MAGTARYGRRYMKKGEDFAEGEVWGMTEERESSSPMLRNSIKKIPRSLSSSIEAPTQNKQQFSAPLDIPDWSKIYGKSASKNKSHNYNFATHSSSSSSSWAHHHDHDGDDGDVHDDDDDDDEDDGMVPPHEYLARKLARSQISSFSVYEGIGRTLKGRDLSQVRNAILTKTGFLES